MPSLRGTVTEQNLKEAIARREPGEPPRFDLF
jgi:hypothetical protein